jgi:hypothetical protein
MKNSPKKRPPATAKPVLPTLPLLPVTMAIDGMLSTLQGLVGVFDRSVTAEVQQLITLTKALKGHACAEPRRPRRRK